jgi:hypothetical protein
MLRARFVEGAFMERTRSDAEPFEDRDKVDASIAAGVLRTERRSA